MRACYHRHEKGGREKGGRLLMLHSSSGSSAHHIEEVGAVPVTPVLKLINIRVLFFFHTRRLDNNIHKRQLLTVGSDS